MLEQGFQMVKGNVEKITELSMDLLNYGKYMSLSPRKIDPNQPAREVTDLLEEKARMNRIIFFTDYCHHLKSMNIDPDAIHCCLLNLVGNALDACMAVDTPKQREIRLTVRAWTGRGVIYTVTDTGCGMDEEARNRIFNGFFTTKGSHGTGIGLMMTRNILEKHGGEIEWVSEKGTGSTFVVRFKEIHE
jgi:signal transduction histidine kinase